MDEKEWTSNTKPKYCCWVLNYRCMFKCKVCYIWQNDEKTPETTLDEKKRFISSLKGFVDPDFEFHLSGGEPLLNENICEIIAHIRSYNYRTNLVTNGWLVDDAMAERLSDVGLNSLTFSLDGFKEETHDFLRGMPGSHKRIMDAIDLCARKNTHFKTSVLMLVTEKNIDEVLPLVDWVERNQAIEMISFQAITQPFSQERNDEWFRKEENSFLWPQDEKKVMSVMGELARRRRSGAKIGNQANHFSAFGDYFVDPNQFLKKIKCNLGDYEFHVDPFGKIFFCCFIDPIGNIKNDCVPDLWFSEKARECREAVYQCRQNCHIMINCFFEEENT